MLSTATQEMPMARGRSLTGFWAAGPQGHCSGPTFISSMMKLR
jgi:hypothetical protein